MAHELRTPLATLVGYLEGFEDGIIQPSDATWSPDAIVMSVTDQGPGLTDEQRERVFERFYRADPSRSRALGGSGIGLAITKALVELMGGRIWAASEGPGHGSTFHVALPRETG